MAEKVQIRLIKSTIGRKPAQRKTVRALGLKKINSVVVHEKNLPIMGMIQTVRHLVEVEEAK
jgi:large subunit ribosomal protein L30